MADQQPDDRARPYKSRSRRPCDFCRYKRAACLLAAAPPCELCARHGKQCTFVENPAKRRRCSSDHGVHTDSPTSPVAASPAPSRLLPADARASAVTQHSTPPEPALLLASDPAHDPPHEPSSLDAATGHNAQIVGLSGESDPYLLRLYRFDDSDQCPFQQLSIRNVGLSDGVPVQFMVQDNYLASKAQPADFGKSVSAIRDEITAMVENDVGKRLVRLFFRYVQPYFPVLSHERIVRTADCDPGAIPTCLLAAIYGHALPFCVFDDRLCVQVYQPPSPDDLFQLAWQSALPQYHTPSLSVVQTLLLLVQRRPTNRHVADTPFKWTMMAEIFALAQTLGLNIDPSGWSIPHWERRLRRRLAWAVYVQDKWLSLNFGRSSHIQMDDWDVEPLSQDDFDDAGSTQFALCNHFLHLVALTQIVAQIQSNLFSLKATRYLSGSLEATFDAAKPLRIALADWSQAHPLVAARTSASQDLDGNGSLRLAYITAKVSIFRALLRPKISEASTGARIALRIGAIGVAREMYDFLSGLETHHLEAFWHSYSRVNFAIASNFMVLLFASSLTETDAQESLTLLNRWRNLLRIKSRSCNLLNLSLLRLDAMYVAGLDRLVELSPAASSAFSRSNDSIE
ncbi:fungal specific transcription factor domain protein [Diplodia corticola]|uniref:Fungal specific transcription factor domain protein n=1 Tax=Diplodia corticola TaxID=236234 RepID=A0A1J9S6T5_9PEZI|nr:fungal specific transcription factor domain protein [Diplodia corticola]OJD40659.1 fungal specific transcription factor domain protein [Diplodia corticola]